MINTYKDIITSPTILKDVGNGQTVGKLIDEISISSQQNSQVFSVNVKTTDPQEAAKIANITAQTFRYKIKSIMSVNNVSIVSKATVNEAPVSPRLPLNIAIGFVFASDAHNLKGRNFRMQKAFAKLEQRNGPEKVAWMQDNAKKIINGDDLEPSEYHHIKEKKKKFWLFR